LKNSVFSISERGKKTPEKHPKTLKKGERNMSYRGEIITSSQNKYVSLTRALSDRKQRQKSSLYRFDGVKLMCEAIVKGVGIDFLMLKESAYDAVISRAYELYSVNIESGNFRVVVASDGVFDKISEENAPEGVITVARYDAERHRALSGSDVAAEDGENILLLESVRDPGNVGAILRTAAAFAVDRVIIGKDCADIYNSKTLRASMGSVFSMKIDRVDSIPDAVSSLQASGRRVFAAALDERAVRLGETEFQSGDCVVIGNEGHGLTDETLKACDATVYIPMSGKVESLNAAVAASVLMWEFFGKQK